MLKEALAPIAAHGTCVETVLVGREVGGNETKDFRWDAVDGDEGVHPFTDSYEGGRNVLFELRDRVQGEATGVVSRPFPN